MKLKMSEQFTNNKKLSVEIFRQGLINMNIHESTDLSWKDSAAHR